MDNNPFRVRDALCISPATSRNKHSSTRCCGSPTSARIGAAAKEARTFIALYYDQVDPEDLADRNPEDLYGAAMAHLRFARRFSTGTPKLRVYNPRAEEHGWSSPHTVIEIVNDDMPFLVDSVTMEVNRQGYTLQLFNHPLFVHAARPRRAAQVPRRAGQDGKPESLIHVEIEREIDPARLKALGEGIMHVLARRARGVRGLAGDARPHGRRS